MTRGKLRWFIFGDRANNGSYVLLKSSEIDEPGTPDWYTMVSAPAASDIAIFLGFRADYFRTNQ